MIKTITILAFALLLSACTTMQPATGTMHKCQHHCEQGQCPHGEDCTCDCKHMDMTGKICPKHAPMSTPAKP